MNLPRRKEQQERFKKKQEIIVSLKPRDKNVSRREGMGCLGGSAECPTLDFR